MANRLANLLGNTKTRTLVLLVIGILTFGVAIAVLQTDSSTDKDAASRVSKTTEVPNQVKSTPGEQVSRKYKELQEQANIRGAQEAEKKGVTFIPTLTGNAEGYNDADFDKQLSVAFDDLGGKCSKETVAKLRKDGMDTTKIIMELKSYGCSSAAISSLFSSDEIAAALLAAKDCNVGDIKGCSADDAKKMKAQGFDSSKIAATFKSNGCSITDITTALKANGATAGEIALALTKSGFSNLEVLGALNKAGFNPIDIAKAMSSLDLQGADAAALLAQQRASEGNLQRLSAQQESQQLAAFSQQRQAKIQELVAAMDAQKNQAMATWNDIPQQVLVEGEWAAKKAAALASNEANGGSNSATGTNAAAPKIILKSGAILFATLDTAVNSDEKGPILATIVSGPLKGSRLTGTMTVQTDADALTLSFTSINMPNEEKSMGISAVAIDPDTARTALASDVDHHYLMRWGSLFASSFIQGYASAVASAGQTSTTTQGAAGTVTNTTTPPLDGRQQLFEGLSAVATKWSEIVGKNFDRPNTITIDQGTGIGILVTADLEYGSKPQFYSAAPTNPIISQTLTTTTAPAGANLSNDQTAALISTLLKQQQTSSTTTTTGGNQ